MFKKMINNKYIPVCLWVCSVISLIFPQDVHNWALEFHARDVDSLGIGDYIKLEMEDHEPYFDCGIKKSFGPLVIIIPLYQNWDDDPYAKDTDWILDRMRFSLSISSFNIRNMY